VQETEIRITGEGDEVRIKTDYSRLRSHHRGFFGMFDDNINQPSVYYTIKMPKTARLTLKDYKSKSTVADLQSDLRIDTYKGEVEVSNLTGSVELKTYKGDSRVSFSKLAGDSEFESSKGNVEITLPKSTGFVIDYDLGRRAGFRTDFAVESVSRARHRREEARSSETVNGGGPHIHLSSDKGDFSIREE